MKKEEQVDRKGEQHFLGMVSCIYSSAQLAKPSKLVGMTYAWWKKSCTSWYGKYPTIYRVWYLPGGCLEFLPSTVFLEKIGNLFCRKLKVQLFSQWLIASLLTKNYLNLDGQFTVSIGFSLRLIPNILLRKKTRSHHSWFWNLTCFWHNDWTSMLLDLKSCTYRLNMAFHQTPEFFSSSFAQTTIRDFIAFPKNNMGSSVVSKKSSFFQADGVKLTEQKNGGYCWWKKSCTSW